MISAIFVDRPRLAVVIAIVITIAGLLALTRIPVAQFPDIVPPQTAVSTTYPAPLPPSSNRASPSRSKRRSSAAIEQMIYMKSTSANDGSYNLATVNDFAPQQG